MSGFLGRSLTEAQKERLEKYEEEMRAKRERDLRELDRRHRLWRLKFYGGWFLSFVLICILVLLLDNYLKGLK